MTDQVPDLETARRLIYAADLQLVVDRLVNIERWRRADAEAVVEQYRNYLFLRRKFPNEAFPPSEEIDEAWHAHVLHTADYREFCRSVFPDFDNQFFDHVPAKFEPGMEERLADGFVKTQNLYKQEFGQYLYRTVGRSYFGRTLDAFRDYLLNKFPRLAAVVEGG